jgi:hypothetical protein
MVAATAARSARRPSQKEKRFGQFHEPQQRGNVSASEASLSRRLGRRLLRYGIVLFLLGLATAGWWSPFPSRAWAFPVTSKA